MLSSTEGFYGEGRYLENKEYLLYNKEKYIKDYKYLYKNTDFIKENTLPQVWTKEFTNIWNCFITSSVVVQKKLFDNLGGFRNLPMWADYDCWKGLQQLTDSLYIDIPLFILMACMDTVEIMKNNIPKVLFFYQSGRKERLSNKQEYAKEMFYGYHFF